MKCENCGKKLMDNATFCTSCGWKTDKWKDEVKKSKTNQNINVLSISILVIVFVLMVLLFLIVI